jgi:hypothetical protein
LTTSYNILQLTTLYNNWQHFTTFYNNGQHLTIYNILLHFTTIDNTLQFTALYNILQSFTTIETFDNKLQFTTSYSTRQQVTIYNDLHRFTTILQFTNIYNLQEFTIYKTYNFTSIRSILLRCAVLPLCGRFRVATIFRGVSRILFTSFYYFNLKARIVEFWGPRGLNWRPGVILKNMREMRRPEFILK